MAVTVLSVVAGFAIGAAQPRPVATERIADVTVQVLVEGGKLLVGTNDIVLELRPSAGPPDVSDVILTAARSGAQDESIRGLTFRRVVLADSSGHWCCLGLTATAA